MNLSPNEKEWLRNQCVEPIITSALRRIRYQEKLVRFSPEFVHLIRTACIFALDKFASNGIEFDSNGAEIDVSSYANEIVTHFNLGSKKEIINSLCNFLTDIQQYCFREMQALQIVQLEYSALTREELRQKVAAKLKEEYQPAHECNNGLGLSESAMIHRSIEMNAFYDNCAKIRNTETPL